MRYNEGTEVGTRTKGAYTTVTVCFTGHRDIGRDFSALSRRLDETVEALIARGATCFRTGGAIGFDTMAARSVLEARRRHPHIRLELYLPFPEQDRHWALSDREVFLQILEQADGHRYLCPHYHSGAYHIRNRALVEGADVCVSYYTGGGGGTAFTVKHALGCGLEYIALAT